MRPCSIRTCRLLLIGLLATILLAACQMPDLEMLATPSPSPLAQPDNTSEESELADYPNADLLVDVAWLAARLDDDSIRIIDMRSADAYAQGHIPGAVNIPIGQIASTINLIPLSFDRDAVQQALNQAGLTPETTAVIYDDLGMMNAARLFWTLEYVGHEDARVLHGGWNAWMDAEGDVTDDHPAIEPGNYEIQLQPSKLITAEELLERLDDPDVTIVDARSPQEYTGEVRLAQQGGHIPGAVNLVWLDALTGGDAVYTIEEDWQAQLQDEDVEIFKSPAEIQSMLDELGIERGDEIVTYCQTLWRGAHVYFLLRLMGYENVRGYDGSWAEWGNRPELPVVTGPEPGSVEDEMARSSGL